MAQYEILSPDGFTIEYVPFYSSKKKATDAFKKWLKRYEFQGYYSSTRFGRIPLNKVKNYCQFNKF